MPFELTNAQRKCFALPEVENDWTKLCFPRGKYYGSDTLAYVSPDNQIRKVVVSGDDVYFEYGVCETLSADRTLILPKTAKGKPVKATAPALTKKTPVGMGIWFCNEHVWIDNHSTGTDYYHSGYTGNEPKNIDDFAKWVDKWCEDTTEYDIADINAFARAPKAHIRYKEGDFFKFRIDRQLWGYGRILLDFDLMRKQNIPFWRIFMGKPLCVAVYHIATTDSEVPIGKLKELQTMPPEMIMDDSFYYGEYKIIGNEPVCESDFDFPIHYGYSISGNNRLMYQCGRKFLWLEGAKEIEHKELRLIHNIIGSHFNITLPLLSECIRKKSNQPYWDQKTKWTDEDLRNPSNKELLAQIKKQFNID